MSLAYAYQSVEPLPVERSLDLDHLSRRTSGDAALEREVLAIFRRQARQVLFQLEAMTDPHTRLKIAQSLNGSAKGVGAWRVAEAAEALEAAMRDERPAGAVVADLAESISDAIGEIDNVLEG
ncbi:Hpt domain-containing protein [Terrihabitans rhizophilus]|jgi:HPt (histidine-containing phosphotransfer) domain-containing protein|uniref:Hpt domain-containing protein n=1 Tax=Terrihabitans rhizophilus TaxID=3092662 RepID=A0ABU4RQB8_9HYPH|nr:Hpt domain-containing protein [Terrihabitans sp. PJ23]MDX6807049.1 Hpt domain-containing protein [Terrihabitans sp. PJ23]